MNLKEVFNFLYLEIQNLETLGVIFGLISVWLTVKENILCWFFGIVNVFLFAWVFYSSFIYGQLILQLFFLILIIYGWYEWQHGGENKSNLKIRRIFKSEAIKSLIITFILALVLFFGIQNFSKKENFSKLDSVITSMSFTAQYFMAKKVLESWILWILINVLSIYLFWVTGLFKVSFFYFVLLILAHVGYFSWRNTLTQNDK